MKLPGENTEEALEDISEGNRMPDRNISSTGKK